MAAYGKGDPRWLVADREDGKNMDYWHWFVSIISRAQASNLDVCLLSHILTRLSTIHHHQHQGHEGYYATSRATTREALHQARDPERQVRDAERGERAAMHHRAPVAGLGLDPAERAQGQALLLVR